MAAPTGGRDREDQIIIGRIDVSMSPSIAEFAVAQTLNLLRDIPTAIALMRAGGWKESVIDSLAYCHGDLAGKKVGLAGYGAINKRYHQLISGFGCRVAAYTPTLDPSRAERLGLTYTGSLEELAAASEIFVVGIPPLKSSLGAIGKTVFDALPVGGLFVLVSRMAVVDEPALWDAVNNRGLRAAIDVFGAEPVPPDAPFRFHPNVLPTPHIAGAPFYQQERCFYDACVDCLAVTKGQPRRFEATHIDATK
ncbi:NAD(P)-dependent oxidoreductase [Mesorhizobium sp. M0578]|uniref:NAD(P)-dependent oxidoreductase n=1 Tax=unclassified Mesorhizobium TaxID=325217 RepID=UPI00333D4DFA